VGIRPEVAGVLHLTARHLRPTQARPERVPHRTIHVTPDGESYQREEREGRTRRGGEWSAHIVVARGGVPNKLGRAREGVKHRAQPSLSPAAFDLRLYTPLLGPDALHA